MPRGKNTNVYLQCTACKMQNYTTRMNKKNTEALELKKYCGKCNTSVAHKNTKEIKHSS